MPHYCIVCVRAAWYGSFRTRGLQYRSYHGWCITTKLCACTTPVHAAWYGNFGASQLVPYCVHVHVACCCYGSFRAPAVHYRLYHAVTTIWRCPSCIHCGVTFAFVCFANSTLITSFLKLPCLPSFPSQLLALPLSCSLLFLVSFCIVVLLLFLLIVVLLFVIAPWWIWWSLFFLLSVRHYRIVYTYSTGCNGRVVSVHLRYSTVCTMLERWFDIALFAGVTFVCFAKSMHIDHFVLTFVSLFDSDSHYFLSFCSSLLLYTKNAINPHLLCFLR